MILSRAAQPRAVFLARALGKNSPLRLLLQNCQHLYAQSLSWQPILRNHRMDKSARRGQFCVICSVSGIHFSGSLCGGVCVC